MLGVFALLTLSACHRSSQIGDTNARHYEARGIIRGFAPNRQTVDVEHEEIRGFMPSMTMPFSVRNSSEIAKLNIGDAVSFRLTVTDQDSWIDRIKKISAANVHLPLGTAMPLRTSASNTSPRLREGDMMPPFQLIDQDGNKIEMEKFRGHPLVLTFIFTRCPLPNFCPLMSNNFAQLQTAIKNSSGQPGQTRLLSISFDPEFDSREVLHAYAQHESADPNIWTFASGQKAEIDKLTQAFPVFLQQEGGTISHGLATALISRDGKIAKIWRGNGWTPAEVMLEIARAGLG